MTYLLISLFSDCIAHTVKHYKYGRPCPDVTELEKQMTDDYVSKKYNYSTDRSDNSLPPFLATKKIM